MRDTQPYTEGSMQNPQTLYWRQYAIFSILILNVVCDFLKSYPEGGMRDSQTLY